MPDQPKHSTIITQGDTLLMDHTGKLVDSLYWAAANHLTSSERLDLIERLQASHDQIEATWR